MKTILFLVVLGLCTSAYTQHRYEDKIQPAVFAITMVQLHDVVNPPAAARFFTYSLLPAYDLVSAVDASATPPSVIFRHYTDYRPSIDKKQLDLGFAAVYTILETGRLLLPSGYLLEKNCADLEAYARKNGLSENRLEYSMQLAKAYAAHAVAFSKSDGYLKLSTLIRYSPKKTDGHWYPTPPAYIEAIEPNWKTIRPMMLDSAGQVAPLPPVAFSRDTSSAFFKMASEVHEIGKRGLREEQEIAAFWDCNPFAVSSSGHMNVGFKKISPGAHWMNIAAIACVQSKLSLAKYLFVQTITAATLMDAFISCWDEKYRSDRIRPETYINQEIDRNWQPLLQTPPFPEYTSGHSVVSGAAAVLLTAIFGNKYAYTDDTEIMFDLPARRFESFEQAANEAAISRLYGGIHFRDAIDQGLVQGRTIGKLVVGRMQQMLTLAAVK